MPRKFDRPTTAYFQSPLLLTRWADKMLSALEGELGALSEATAAASAAAAAALTANWSGVSDDNGHKPEDDATLGADLATNVTGTLDNVTDGTIYAKIKGSELSAGKHKLTVGNSGVQIGDQRNLPPIAAANLRYLFTGTSSYSAAAGSPATATISVTAGSLILGSTSISYNAMSANVSGTGGTSATYYLYVSTNAYSGGAHTLHATTTGTDIYSNDSYVYIDTITVAFPASGTSSGSGDGSGGGFCLAASSFYLMVDGSEKRGADLKVGDSLDTCDEFTGKRRAARVLAVRFACEWVYEREGWPDATRLHPFAVPMWLFGWLPRRLRYFRAGWLGRKARYTTVAKVTTEAGTYIARHPKSNRYRLSHNTKPGAPG